MTRDNAPSVLVLDQHEDSDWKELPRWVREAAEGIGYTKKLWDKDKEPKVCDESWEDLTDSQQTSAKRLGYTRKLWDESDESSSDGSTPAVLVLDQHGNSDWGDIPEWVREAAGGIGYNKKLWNIGKEPKVCGKFWKDLTDSQQKAAKRLGYTRKLWDESDESSSDGSMVAKKVRTKGPPRAALRLEDVHKHTKWTIYCIQLYTETKDYQFRIEENKGLTMYANRPLGADEYIIQSPVGPNIHEGLFEQSSDSDGVLSEERKGFAERFLEWDKTHRKSKRIGGMNAQIVIKLEDFSNPSIMSKDYRSLPKPDWPVYDMELFEHEIVIAEFVPPPFNPTHELPPPRRFEILSYEEALVGMMGEKGYDPHTMKRPPTLCGMEVRSLELPGHFSNHASGATSTAYDFIRMGQCLDAKFQQPKDLPEFLRNEMAAKARAEDLGEISHLTSRRAIETGTEITTDYSRWHWTNGDIAYGGKARRTPLGFFLGSANNKRWEWGDLEPKMLRAAQILGYTQAMWDSKETPASFGRAWKSLSLQEREAAINLTGHTKESWDARSGIEHDDDSSSLASVGDIDWAEFSEDQRNAAVTAGYTEAIWDGEDDDEDELFEGLWFYNLRPEVRDAMVVLGNTEATWDDDDEDNEPWFECLCGDVDCHSSKKMGGFRGVAHFPLEEQLKVAPLCEPWVQQQLSWKLYQLEQEGQNEKES